MLLGSKAGWIDREGQGRGWTVLGVSLPLWCHLEPCHAYGADVGRFAGAPDSIGQAGDGDVAAKLARGNADLASGLPESACRALLTGDRG
jgi:hypothetical protein